MHMKKIILISAKAEHGKDTFAEILREELEQRGQTVIIDRFAKFIKGYLKDYYNWDGTTKSKSIRTKLQTLGTEKIKEELNFKCFHAKRLSEDFQIVADDFDTFLVPDTRFKDEINYFKAMFPDDCITIRLERAGFENHLTEEQKKHKSECDLDGYKFDYYIETKNLKDLKIAAKNFANDILGECDG